MSHPAWTPQKDRSGALLLLIAIASAAFSTFVVSQKTWLDDAFISFRYARNLYEGAGLVFNAGDRVEGYTNFLWTIVAYGGLHFGFTPIAFAQVASVSAQILTLWMVYLLGTAPTRPRYQTLIAPVFLAVNLSFLIYPMTGMETTFFTMLLTLAVLLYHRQIHKSRVGAMAIGAVLVAIALTRFDGLVLVVVILSYRLLVRHEVKASIPSIAVFLAGIIAYSAWRLSYYPTLLPNTFYAKVGFTPRQLLLGGLYLARFTADVGQYPLLLGIIPFAVGRTTHTIRFAGWIVLAHLMYVLVVGGDWMPHFRFVLPVLPLVFFLMQEGILAVHDLAKARIASRSNKVFAALALILLFGAGLMPLYKARAFSKAISGDSFHPQDAREIGIYLNKTLPAETVVAAEWAGIVPFYMKQPVLDIFGLTDRDIAARGFPASATGRFPTADYVASRKPDMVILCAWLFKSAEEAGAGAQRRFNSGADTSWVRHFYASLTSAGNGYKLCIMKIDEHAYAPLLIRRDLEGQESLCSDDRVMAGR